MHSCKCECVHACVSAYMCVFYIRFNIFFNEADVGYVSKY